MWRWFILFGILSGGVALGRPTIDPNAVRAVQYALNRIDRYPSGPVDGIIGPLTEHAFQAFSGARPIEEAFWPIAAHLADVVWWDAPWPSDVETAVRATLEKVAKGHRRPRILEKRLWRGRHARAACVLVKSTDNRQWLHMSLRYGWISPKPDAPPEPATIADPPATLSPEISALWCRLGYVIE